MFKTHPIHKLKARERIEITLHKNSVGKRYTSFLVIRLNNFVLIIHLKFRFSVQVKG